MAGERVRKGDYTYDLLPPDAGQARRRFEAARIEAVDAEFTTVAAPPSRQARRAAPEDRRAPLHPASPVRDRAQGRFRGQPGENDNPRRRPLPSRPSSGALSRFEAALERMSLKAFLMLTLWSGLAMFFLVSGFAALASPDGGAPPALSISHVTALAKGDPRLGIIEITGIIENHGRDNVTPGSIRADFLTGGTVAGRTEFAVADLPIAPGTSRGFAARLSYAGGKMPEVRLSFAGEAY